ncbi:hypothetical protein B0J12DRAFT_738945 [Macrophomina phaseolina]|uniref:Uncharacterized protein n=1 Tax=Macrophomina phaseolina TaxID=35725 RepID=A0ABQ8GFI2_9PEZI|nr:hypothetical protein B0J12DRAFT_738945 [Macrophomina phaseolina]
MPSEGCCNCSAIRVFVKEKQSSSLLSSSVNYLLDETDVRLEDPKSFLKAYQDADTVAGATGLVRHIV